MKRRFFARVVHRQGWDVELVDAQNQANPDSRNFGTRDEALAFAQSGEPQWIEVGEVVPARDGVPQHHEWTTLRRDERGKYSSSPLVWGGGTARTPTETSTH